MTPRVWKIILVVAFKAWCCCALSLAAPSLVLAQSSPPLPDDIRIEPPAGNLPPEIQAFSGAWEGEWRETVRSFAPNIRPEQGSRLKAILVVEKVSGQEATVVYARGECPEWRVSQGWGRYEATISPHDGRLGLSFSVKGVGKRTFFINNRGNIEGTAMGVHVGVREIEMTRMADIAHLKKPMQMPSTQYVAPVSEPINGAIKVKDWKMRQPMRSTMGPTGGYYVVPAGVGASTPENLYFQGIKSLSQGQFEEAVGRLSKCLEQNSKFGEAYINRGLAYALQGRYEQAISDCNKFIEIDPKDHEAYYNRGVTYAQKGQYDLALTDFNQALKLRPQDAQTHYFRGFVNYKKGWMDKAKADFQTALKVDPDYVKNAQFRGTGELKTYGEILQGKRPAPDPGSEEMAVKKEDVIHKKQALALARKGQYDEAITEFAKALEANPRDAEAYNSQGSTYTLKGQYDQALADFNKALELNPKYAKAYYNRALAYYYKGRYDEAIADLTKATELQPKDAEAYHNRGLAYDQKRSYDKAISDFNKAIALKPKLADAYFNKAVTCERAGREDEAREAYAAFVKLAPPEAAAQVEQAKKRLK